MDRSVVFPHVPKIKGPGLGDPGPFQPAMKTSQNQSALRRGDPTCCYTKYHVLGNHQRKRDWLLADQEELRSITVRCMGYKAGRIIHGRKQIPSGTQTWFARKTMEKNVI